MVVGDQKGILLPDLSRYRSSLARLRGLRCIHTHLFGEGLDKEDLTDLALLRLDLMGVIALDKRGRPLFHHLAYLLPTNENGQGWRLLKPISYGQLHLDFESLITGLEKEFERMQRTHSIEKCKDKAILIHVSEPRTKIEAKTSLIELSELANTAGVEIVDKIIQHPKQINARFFIGKGKLVEVVIRALQTGANLLIFDHELNPSQVKSLTSFTDLRVIDRTQLILDIFAQRAKTKEGKIQVEMAQLKYLLPRLVKQDASMSRLTGGIGGRGPGETKLEIDRRRIKEKLHHLQKELKTVRAQRSQRRIRRRRSELPIISIIGYTNAGKSTLLNVLTDSAVVVEKRLFATLDPTTRRLRFPNEKEAVITDTVGFIRNLPKELMDAFAATLEELYEADLLINVIDISNPSFPKHVEVVEQILSQLRLNHIPILKVFNKKDLVPKVYVRQQCQRYNTIAISAIQPKTTIPLVDEIEKILGKLTYPTQKFCPNGFGQESRTGGIIR